MPRIVCQDDRYRVGRLLGALEVRRKSRPGNFSTWEQIQNEGFVIVGSPATVRDRLKAIAERTGGKFFRARSAGSVEQAYSALGSTLGRKSGMVEVTDWFLVGAAILLVLAGVLSALWSPRLP